MTDSVLSPSLDYKPATYRHGTKTYSRLFQQTGGEAFDIPVSSSVESIFEIPQKAFYLADSYIQYYAVPTAPGATVHHNWFHAQHNLISEIHLYTRGGKYLAQLNNLPNYMEMTQGMNTDLVNFLGSDELDRYRPSRGLGTTAINGGRPVGTLTTGSPYTEQLYLERGDDTTATPALTIKFRLGAIKDTIFALKKAMILPETILMRIVWGPAQRFQWFGTSATVPATGAADPAGVIGVSRMCLFLALETDPDVINDLRSQATKGFQLPIPFVSVRKYTDGGGSDKSITMKITPDMGFAVKRLVYAPFNVQEKWNTGFDHDNRAGGKIQTYQTSLDSINRQQYPVDCTWYHDWDLHKWLFVNTPVQNRDNYQYNWVHVEDFSDLSVERKGELRPQCNPDNIIAGMPIVQNGLTERIWNIHTTAGGAAAYTHYMCIIGYKTLIVGGGAVDVLSMPPSA